MIGKPIYDETEPTASSATMASMNPSKKWRKSYFVLNFF